MIPLSFHIAPLFQDPHPQRQQLQEVPMCVRQGQGPGVQVASCRVCQDQGFPGHETSSTKPGTAAAAAAAESLQSCLTLCNPRDGSPPGSPVPGILQARMEWVAISFSNA